MVATVMVMDYSELEQRVAMIFDKTTGNVTFYKNGLSQGVAFLNVTTGFYPVLIMNFESGHIEILLQREPQSRVYL